MRKFYLLFAALFAFSVVATAGVKNLFKQDFESVTDPASIGWTSPNLPGGMSILSDEYGSFFQFSLGSNNGRSCNMLWKDQVNYEGITKYDVCFSWSLAQNANNQYSSEICVYTDDKGPGNNNWMSNNANAHWLFTLTQADVENFYVNNNLCLPMVLISWLAATIAFISWTISLSSQTWRVTSQTILLLL